MYIFSHLCRTDRFTTSWYVDVSLEPQGISRGLHLRNTLKKLAPRAIRDVFETPAKSQAAPTHSTPVLADTLDDQRRSPHLPVTALFVRSVPYVLVALTTIVALIITQRLWKANLSYPLQVLGADSTLSVYIAKALGENALLYNNRVGAPFGLDYYTFYQPDFVHQAILKGLVWITGNPILAVNLYLLGGFVLIALTAFYVLRRFQLSIIVALLCAVLYAFTPSHLWRSYYHLFLSEYYLLPLVVLLALRIMSGDSGLPAARVSSALPHSKGNVLHPTGAIRLLVFALPLSVLVGGSGVYYAFYSMLFVGTAAVWAAFRRGRARYSIIGFACFATIGLTTVIGMLPAEVYKLKFGANSYVAQRPLGDTDVYSLKIADLYLPMPQHPIRKLREISKKFNDSFAALDDNESKYSNLGFIGAIGFSALLLWPIIRRSYSVDDRLIKYLLVLTLVGVLFATTGGFGSLFSLLVVSVFRCNNRLVFFVAFFALFGSGLILEKLLRRLPLTFLGRLASIASVLALLTFGLYDQGATTMRGNVASISAQYKAGARFIQRIESRLPAGAMVLQLPYQPFPEVAGIYHMNIYDPFKAYLHSKGLRWSYPDMGGGPEDEWIKELSSEPVPELIKRAVWAGFRGIYIDRLGYPDAAAALETQLRAETHIRPITGGPYDRFSFFSLENYAAALKQRTPPDQWSKLVSEMNPHMLITYPSGVYGPEIVGTGEWRWCNKRGIINIFNSTGHTRTVELTGRLSTAFPITSFVFFRDSKQSLKAVATAAGSDFDWHLTLKRGSNRIEFHTNANRVPAPRDPRVMYFRMEYLRIR